MPTFKWVILSLNAFELATFITGLVYWKKWAGTYWKWFTVFLAFTFLSEMVAKYCSFHENLTMYNKALYRYINIPVTICFYLWVFMRHFAGTRYATWARAAIGLFLFALLLEGFVLHDFYKLYGSFSYQVGIVGLLVMCFAYFVRLLGSEDILHFKKSMIFWVAVGLLVYYVATFPFNAMHNTLWQKNQSLFWTYWYISFIFNYAMYMCFITGFVWATPKSQSSS